MADGGDVAKSHGSQNGDREIDGRRLVQGLREPLGVCAGQRGVRHREHEHEQGDGGDHGRPGPQLGQRVPGDGIDLQGNYSREHQQRAHKPYADVAIGDVAGRHHRIDGDEDGDGEQGAHHHSCERSRSLHLGEITESWRRCFCLRAGLVEIAHGRDCTPTSPTSALASHPSPIGGMHAECVPK